MLLFTLASCLKKDKMKNKRIYRIGGEMVEGQDVEKVGSSPSGR